MPTVVHPPGVVAGLPSLIATHPYSGPWRDAIVAWKERGRRDLLDVLVAHGHEALRQWTTGPVCLVPVPARAAARRARGADVMVELAQGLAARGGHLCRRILRHTRSSADQAGLDRAARMANVRGSLTVQRRGASVSTGPLVLLDDIVTTGATAREAVRALHAAGIAVDAVLVLARAGTRASIPTNAPDPETGAMGAL